MSLGTADQYTSTTPPSSKTNSAGAHNRSNGYFVIDVSIEGQQFRTENTFVTVSRVNAAGWREGHASIGPVPGASSTVGLEHKLGAELSAEGVISLWLDRQPLGSAVLPGLELPAHVGLATYSMLGKPGPNSPGGKIGMGLFADMVIHGEVVAPCFDARPTPTHNWEAIHLDLSHCRRSRSIDYHSGTNSSAPIRSEHRCI